MVQQFLTAPPALLVLTGRPQAGKTSFIRAGLIPKLPADRFLPVYVRCTRDLEPHLQAVLSHLLKQDVTAMPWDATFALLKSSTPKHVVLFLDQFEKPARAWAASRENAATIFGFLTQVIGAGGGNLSLVCSGLEGGPLWKLLAWRVYRSSSARSNRCRPARCSGSSASRRSRRGTPLSNEDIRDICSRYEQTLSEQGGGERRPFTLTHVQTACYYLAKARSLRWEGFDRFPNLGLQAALTASRDDGSLTDLLDDLPAHERRLIRSFLKIICDPSGNTTRWSSSSAITFQSSPRIAFPSRLHDLARAAGRGSRLPRSTDDVGGHLDSGGRGRAGGGATHHRQPRRDHRAVRSRAGSTSSCAAGSCRSSSEMAGRVSRA